MLLVMVGAHEDMSSFVAVMAGLLIGTSVWAGPKNAVCTFFEETCEWVRKVFFLRLCSWGRLSVSDALLGQEKMYEHFKEECERFKARINGWMFGLYAVVSVIFGWVAIYELYLGKSAEWAEYNGYLVLPIAFYLFACLIRSVKFAAVIIWETVKYYGYFSVLHEKGIIGYVADSSQSNKDSIKKSLLSQVKNMKRAQSAVGTETADNVPPTHAASPETSATAPTEEKASASGQAQTDADASVPQEAKTEGSAAHDSHP